MSLGSLFTIPQIFFEQALSQAATRQREGPDGKGASNGSRNDPSLSDDLSGSLISRLDVQVKKKVDEGPTCIACGIGITGPGFSSPEEQRAHFKTDLHRYNVKRRISQQKPLTAEQFEAMLGNESEVSSISGSESEDESDQDEDGDGGNRCRGPAFGLAPRSSFVSNGTSFSVWRCLLLRDRALKASQMLSDPDPTSDNLLESLQKLRRKPGGVWVVILLLGGHFAAAVFQSKDVSPSKKMSPDAVNNGCYGTDFTSALSVSGSAGNNGNGGGKGGVLDGFEVVAHKTFHRYVVRAKAGGRQSTKDSGGKNIHSAGSTLRRYNESALEGDIAELFEKWEPHLSAADLVFVHAPSANARALYSDEQKTLLASDPRVRRIPFVTRRPTFQETKRIVAALAEVRREAPPPEKEKENESTGRGGPGPHPSAANRAAIGASATVTSGPSGDSGPKIGTKALGAGASAPPPLDAAARRPFENEDAEANAAAGAGPSSMAAEAVVDSALHLAARGGSAVAVAALLQGGADPSVRDAKGNTAFSVASSNEVRDAFRSYAARHAAAWDYAAAGITAGGDGTSKKAKAKAKAKASAAAAKAASAAVSTPSSCAAVEDQDGWEDELSRALREVEESEKRRAKEAAAAATENRGKSGGSSSRAPSTAGGGSRSQSAAGAKKPGDAKAKAGTSSSATSREDDLARRRQLMAEAAEARMKALQQASQQQKLW